MAGLLAEMTIRDGFVESIEFVPLELFEGDEYFDKYNTADFLTRRGLSEVATGALASEILERFRSLSARYGAEVKIRGERAFIEINGNN